MRWIGHALGALVTFVVVMPTASAFMHSGWVTERIESYVSGMLGVPLDIGELDIDLLSTTPGGRATDVSIGDGAGGTIVAEADLVFEIAAGSVLGGELVIARLELSNAEIDLVVDEQGRGNWESLLPPAAADEESASSEGLSGIPTVRSLSVQDVDVDYIDRALGRKASLALSASGSTIEPGRPLRLEARGRIDDLPALAEVTLVPQGDPVAPSGSLGVEGSLGIGEIDLAVEGTIGEPTALEEIDLAVMLAAPDAEDIESLATLELPELGPLRLDGGVERDGGDWRLREVVASIGETRFEVDGSLGDPASPEGLAPGLSFSLSGPSGSDVAPLVEAFTGTELPPLAAFSASGGIRGGEGDWRFEEVQARLGETRFEVDGGLGDPLSPDGIAPDLTFSLSGPNGSDVAPLVEAFAGTELPALPSFSASGVISDEGGEWILRDVDARLGDLVLTLSGALGDPFGSDGLDPRIDFSFEAPDLRDVEAVTGAELPALSPLALSGSVRRDGDDWVLRRFDGVVGASSVAGDVRVDPTTVPPTVYANLIVPELHLDELLDALDGPATDETSTSSEQASAEEASGWLPDEPLELRPLVRAVDGAVRLRVRDIVSTSLPLESFAGRLEIDGNEIALSSLRVGVGGGTVGGGIELDVAPVPAEGIVEVRARGIDLKKVMRTLGIDDDSFGTIAGRAKYWVVGDSVASLLGNADGGLLLLMTGGKLDALLAELSAIDVIESLLLVLDPGKTLTAIDCGYLDLQTADGVSDIETFVLETADTVFLADGTIDLQRESFDLAFEPHPKDASLIELSTAVRISGRPGDISVTPGLEIGARAAAAAVLSALGTPIAALLAFVETGDAESTPYCDGLVGALDDER